MTSESGVTDGPDASLPRPAVPAALAVGALGILLLGLLLHLSIRYAPPLPFWDDWVLVPYVTGRAPVTAEWLWSPQNEHRILLPRLAFLLLARTSGFDARVFAVLGAATMGALVIVSLLVIRRLRGRILLCDAFFPLLLLHGNHTENTTWPIQIWYFIQAALLFGLFTGILLHDDRRPGRTAWLVGGCLLAIPISGGLGLPTALLLAPWLIAVSVRAWRRSPEAGRGAAVVGCVLGVATLILCGLYFIGLETADGPPSAALGIAAGAKCLATSFGGVVRKLWPVSGVGACLLAALATAILVGGVWRGAGERSRAVGLFLALAGVCGVAAAIGWGRAAMGAEFPFFRRYTIVTCLMPWLLYFGAELYTGSVLRRAIQIGLAALALLVVWPNTTDGVDQLRIRDARAQALLLDVRQGGSLDGIADRHAMWWYPDRNFFRERLQMLAEERMHPYALTPPPHLLGATPALAALEAVRKGSPETGEMRSLSAETQVLFAHAPSVLASAVPDGAVGVRVAFGLAPGAYAGAGGGGGGGPEGGGRTDGVAFRLLLSSDAEGSRRIWSRTLRPLTRPDDRGLQLVELALPPGVSRRLILETHPGEAEDPSWDWAYWTGLAYPETTDAR